VNKTRAPGLLNFDGCASYFLFGSMSLAPCYLSGAYNFEVASILLGYLCTPDRRARARARTHTHTQCLGRDSQSCVA